MSGPDNEELRAYQNQAGAELAFAKSMGWDDWTPYEEPGGLTTGGTVRGYHVQWSPDPYAALVVHDDGDDDAVWVLVTGELPGPFTVHGWTTVGEAKRQGKRIGEG
jgi:hypothetical protein